MSAPDTRLRRMTLDPTPLVPAEPEPPVAAPAAADGVGRVGRVDGEPGSVRDRPALEMLIVLGLTLGQSAVWSVVSIVEKLTRPQAPPLNQQTTTMNTSVTPDRPWLDLTIQVLNIGFPLVQVLLVLYLLHLAHGSARRLIGFDLRRPWRDLAYGLGICAAIGIPGLGFYLAARELGVNTNVAPANLTAHWWTVPTYVGLATMNGMVEEVIMLGYVLTRFGDLRRARLESSGGHRSAAARVADLIVSPAGAVVISAVVRGGYHLYQGFGGFAGNIIMGLAFGYLYLRWKRVMPLVVAHALIDIFAFVGYSLLAPYVAWL